MYDPHDDTDVPSGTTDGAQMERTLPPVRLEGDQGIQELSRQRGGAAGTPSSEVDENPVLVASNTPGMGFSNGTNGLCARRPQLRWPI